MQEMMQKGKAHVMQREQRLLDALPKLGRIWEQDAKRFVPRAGGGTSNDGDSGTEGFGCTTSIPVAFHSRSHLSYIHGSWE